MKFDTGEDYGVLFIQQWYVFSSQSVENLRWTVLVLCIDDLFWIS